MNSQARLREPKTDSTSNSTEEAPPRVIARILRRILAITAAIRHNDYTRQPVLRSLTASGQ
uniref:hypothetical protein n=1 Tax=Streptomyces fagopyri TaxID=2662397 RepID=UPI001885AA2A|nr:hypothetical protein [Streptomyces fagopyri]